MGNDSAMTCWKSLAFCEVALMIMTEGSLFQMVQSRGDWAVILKGLYSPGWTFGMVLAESTTVHFLVVRSLRLDISSSKESTALPALVSLTVKKAWLPGVISL